MCLKSIPCLILLNTFISSTATSSKTSLNHEKIKSYNKIFLFIFTFYLINFISPTDCFLLLPNTAESAALHVLSNAASSIASSSSSSSSSASSSSIQEMAEQSPSSGSSNAIQNLQEPEPPVPGEGPGGPGPPGIPGIGTFGLRMLLDYLRGGGGGGGGGGGDHGGEVESALAFNALKKRFKAKKFQVVPIFIPYRRKPARKKSRHYVDTRVLSQPIDVFRRNKMIYPFFQDHSYFDPSIVLRVCKVNERERSVHFFFFFSVFLIIIISDNFD